jgi:hypothetical protein
VNLHRINGPCFMTVVNDCILPMNDFFVLRSSGALILDRSIVSGSLCEPPSLAPVVPANLP